MADTCGKGLVREVFMPAERRARGDCLSLIVFDVDGNCKSVLSISFSFGSVAADASHLDEVFARA